MLLLNRLPCGGRGDLRQKGILYQLRTVAKELLQAVDRASSVWTNGNERWKTLLRRHRPAGYQPRNLQRRRDSMT